MKFSFTLILLLSFFFNNYKLTAANSPEDIDNLDSVFINFAKATISGSVVEIPVYIHSDDDIYTLDFSFKLDTFKVVYLSLIDHTGHIQYADYFNPLDSKLRFTSNSFQKYPKGDKKVVSLRFKIQETNFSTSDLSLFMSYLNGDQCPNKIKGSDINLTSTFEKYITDNITIKPNPSQDFIYFNSAIDGQLSLLSLEGKQIIRMINVEKNIPVQIDIQTLEKGFYILNFSAGSKKVYSRKIVKV